MNKNWKAAAAFLSLAIFGLLVFRVVPVGIAIVGGFLTESLTGESSFAGLENYAGLVDDPTFWHSLKITLLFNLMINPVQVTVAFMLAILVHKSVRGIGFFRTAYFMPMTVSAAVTAVMWTILLDQSFGPVNGMLDFLGIARQPFFRGESQALITMVLIASWKGVGYWMLFLLAGLNNISNDVYEAGQIDGALGWRRFVHITLPLMKRPLLFVLVAATAVNFLFFAPVYIITSGGPNGATSLLMFEAYQSAFVYVNHGRSLAISTVILVIILLVAAAQFRVMRTAQDH